MSRLRRLANHLWMGPVGRGFFRLAGWRLRGSLHVALASRPGVEVAAGASGVAALLSTLPVEQRKRVREARNVAAQLEKTVTTLDARERELDRALADAGGLTRGGGGESDSPLAERRGQLVADLREARQAATAHRAAVLAALEGLRVELLRLRSGIGTVERVTGEIEAARAAIDPPRVPTLAPAPVSTPV